jgi:hypothetical protein
MARPRLPSRAATLVVSLAAFLWFGASPLAQRAGSTAAPAPASAAAPAPAPLRALGDAEFWRLTTELSETDGTFHSENLVSNEARFQTIVPDLVKRALPGRAYVGVGSEQNFTYIAALRPVHAFILDIRRGNLDLHLLYKALFELSADRAEFVSRLFSRPRPPGLTSTSTAAEIFGAYSTAAPSRELYEQNLSAVLAHLTRTRGFAISEGDREGIAFVYDAWFTNGPDIRYQLTGRGEGGRGGGGRGGFGTTYASLMTATDLDGRNWSYLATEESFQFLRSMQTHNRIVPVVGNFAGPKALRAVATYLRQQTLVVSAFYTSNVQQYLIQDGLWDTFCASAATLPMDETTTMIRSERGNFAGAAPVPGGGFRLELFPLREVVGRCPVGAR